MEIEIQEMLIMVVLGWIISGGICILTLIIYWFGFDGSRWNFELTLLLVIDLGVLGFLIIFTLIITFLSRYKIVRNN